MIRKKLLVTGMVLSFAAATVLSGCAGTSQQANDESVQEDQNTAEVSDVSEEEEPDTGDASLDDPRNADDIGENELLVASFGTSFNDSRRLTIGAIESDLDEEFPDYSVRRGFTSQIIIDHVSTRDGEKIDNIHEALERAVDNGVKNLVVQPTHLMNGYEYDELCEEVANYSDAFEKIAIGKPLLTTDEDFYAVAGELVGAMSDYEEDGTAIVYMGHGTEADSNAVYEKMQGILDEMGKTNYIIGTVEATPSFDDVLAKVKEGGYTRVVLRPMMVVAGDHANNDMAGDDEDSWKSILTSEGYDVECVLSGLGEISGIRKLYAAHAASAINEIQQSDAVASSSDMAAPVELTSQGAAPVFGKDIQDGSYDIDVECSSSMFPIESCELDVNSGDMTATLFMGGTGYRYVYPGQPEEAAFTSEDNYIAPEKKTEVHTFTIPVEALDYPISLAAFSDKKEKWYGRTLVFKSASLPQEALKNATASSASEIEISDGTYQVEVTLSGGSGRANVTSPATVVVTDGKPMATIEWSSPNYDYMIVDGDKYEPENSDGNSVFTIPVLGFDYEMPIKADTTAMSEPHEIDYTLNFDSSGLK